MKNLLNRDTNKMSKKIKMNYKSSGKEIVISQREEGSTVLTVEVDGKFGMVICGSDILDMVKKDRNEFDEWIKKARTKRIQKLFDCGELDK